MTRLTYTYGLPASGKTTFAREVVAKDNSIVRANLDDIRLLLDGPQAKFSKAREKKATNMTLKGVWSGSALSGTCSTQVARIAPMVRKAPSTFLGVKSK